MTPMELIKRWGTGWPPPIALYRHKETGVYYLWVTKLRKRGHFRVWPKPTLRKQGF